MDERPATAHVSLWALIGAMAFGFFILTPLVSWGFFFPPAFLVALVAAAIVLFLLVRTAKRDKGIAATRVGVRGARFAELVKPTGLACPRCSYDLAGAESDRCPECGEDLELIVRTQVHYEFVESQHGPGISERDMRGLNAPTANVLGYAIMLPALVGPAAVVVFKASEGRSPALFSIGGLAYVAWSAWGWWRRRLEDDLPRQRNEAVLGLAIVAVLAIVCSLIDLAY